MKKQALKYSGMQPKCILKHVPFCSAYTMEAKLLGTQFKGPMMSFPACFCRLLSHDICAPTKWMPSPFCKYFMYNQAYVLCAWCSLCPGYLGCPTTKILPMAEILAQQASPLTKPCFSTRSGRIDHFLLCSSTTLDSDCCYTTCFTLSCYHNFPCLYSHTRNHASGRCAYLRRECISQSGRAWMHSNASPSFLIQCWLQGAHKTAGMMESH